MTKACGRCAGSGNVEIDDERYPAWEDCVKCSGTGRVNVMTDPACSKATKHGSACSERCALVWCSWCKKEYVRCSNHGGTTGANRSLGTHKGICPKRPVRP